MALIWVIRRRPAQLAQQQLFRGRSARPPVPTARRGNGRSHARGRDPRVPLRACPALPPPALGPAAPSLLRTEIRSPQSPLPHARQRGAPCQSRRPPTTPRQALRRINLPTADRETGQVLRSLAARARPPPAGALSPFPLRVTPHHKG